MTARLKNTAGCRMLVSVAALGAAALLIAPGALPVFGQSAKTTPAAKKWMQPKTPWGDPDLQGT